MKKYLLNSEIWPRLDRALQCRIFMEHTGKAMLPAYQKCVSNPEILGEDLLPHLTGNASAKTCAAAATFITLFSEKVSVELLKKIYLSLKPLKNAAKVLAPIESDPILMDILGTAQKSAPASSPVVQMLNEILRQRRLSSRELAPWMKTWYGIVPSELPTVQTADQTDAPPEVLMFLLAAHETLRDRVSGPADVVVAYPLPGICPDTDILLLFRLFCHFDPTFR